MFSGGKDSQVMLDLFRRAGVNYHAYYCVTTNDPPENVYFIRKNYPDVTFVHPKRTFLQLIEDKGMLPTRQIRFCCEKLKENHGKGFVATGVRREESTKRKYYKPIEFQSRNKQARVFNEHKMRKKPESAIQSDTGMERRRNLAVHRGQRHPNQSMLRSQRTCRLPFLPIRHKEGTRHQFKPLSAIFQKFHENDTKVYRQRKIRKFRRQRGRMAMVVIKAIHKGLQQTEAAA